MLQIEFSAMVNFIFAKLVVDCEAENSLCRDVTNFDVDIILT